MCKINKSKNIDLQNVSSITERVDIETGHFFHILEWGYN